jgi:hypothetical protein
VPGVTSPLSPSLVRERSFARGRPRKPYFRESDGWWVSRFNGTYQKLAKGRESKGAALRCFHELHLLKQASPPAESPFHTVASVTELYLRAAFAFLRRLRRLRR